MMRRRTIRRWAVRGVVFLLLGAVVNVAVAWGCALQDTSWHLGRSFVVSNQEVLELVQRAFPGHDIAADHISGERHVFGGYEESIVYWAARPQSPDAPIGWLARSFVSPDVRSNRSGWPMLSVWGYTRTDSFERSVPNPSHFKVPNWISPSINGFPVERHMPLWPIWPGFVINTGFYAVILWLLFAAPFALRRWQRVRKGLCGKCAYPIGERDICTECGARLKSKSPMVHSEEPSP